MRRSPLPGFGIALGITLLYVALLVILPLSMIFVKLSGATWDDILKSVLSQRVLSAFLLSAGAALTAAFINALFGSVLAWILVRYRFPFKRLVDALIDLPFALPTAVAGIALTAVYAPTSFLGRMLSSVGVEVAFTKLGVLLAMVFVSLPFVVRSVQPVLSDLEPEIEEASATMGAGRLTTLFRVVIPMLWPTILTGSSLAFARALGEYGSVVFISGNMPLRTEIIPLLIMTRLEGFDYIGASSLAALMLLFSFSIMLITNIASLRAGTRRAA